MPLLIGLTGKALAGKDTVGDLLVTHYGFLKMALANPLKKAAAIAFGESRAVFLTQEGKAETSPCWGLTRRVILQRFGEALRQEFGDDFWVRRWFLDYRPIHTTNHVVVTDVRKDVEANAIRSNGGVIIHIDRPGAGLWGEEARHTSEQGITSRDTDLYIHNSGTLQHLHKCVTSLMAESFSLHEAP
jgi:hypothetical protein